MSTPPTPSISSLTRIREAALEMQSTSVGSRSYPPRLQTQTPTWDFDVIFPHPRPITQELEAVGLDFNAATEFSGAYIAAGSRLRERCKSLLSKCYNGLASLESNGQHESMLSPQLNSSYSNKYQSVLAKWKETTILMSRSFKPKTSDVVCSKARQSFSQENVPLLMKYFEYNAYPSAVDRAMLAKKTGLTLRQVEVWFQNHRNRAKKTGKPIRRLRHDEVPYGFSLNESDTLFCRQSAKHPTTKSSQVNLPSCRVPHKSVTPPIERDSILDSVRHPPHAFPTPFEPSQRLLSASHEAVAFSQPERWCYPRNQVSHRKVPDVDDLCDSFQFSLNLRTLDKRSHGDAFAEETPSRSWATLNYTILPSGRHSSFIPATRTYSSPSKQGSPCNAADGSTLELLRRPYKPLPRRLLRTAFLKYQHQETKLDVVTSSRAAQPGSSLPSPARLRRSASASSVDSSVGCSTPISSPPITTVHLLPENESVADIYIGIGHATDPDRMEPLAKRPRPQHSPTPPSPPDPAHFPLIQAASEC